MYRYTLLLLAAAFGPNLATAAEPSNLTRDEVAVVKKKLTAMLDAAGALPQGYVKNDERFNLPTTAYAAEGGGFRPVSSSAERNFDGGAEAIQQKGQQRLEGDYQKKLAEALAKGDYQAIQKISEDMQKEAGQTHLAAVQARKEPIRLMVQLNPGSSRQIDPDNVVFERPGVIALRTKERRGDKAQIEVFFDPVSLKDTRQLSQFELKVPKEGIIRRNAILNASLALSGPAAEVEAWAKRINTGAVLSLIDGAR